MQMVMSSLEDFLLRQGPSDFAPFLSSVALLAEVKRGTKNKVSGIRDFKSKLMKTKWKEENAPE